ncbi:PH domain-containing protein [Corynebacterium capitovis]|uniref:PH domain-containing protein n=1 Tax=Corynebacterium capitovis TaxID=131081 RepID=UPI0003A170D7|nr:PH domain-containing protein [Corynebacterium capitovis]
MYDTPKVFRPTREHVIAIVLMTGIALIGISWAPLYLGWLLLIPVAWLAWVYASSTRVGEDGIDVRYLAKKNAHIKWADLEGIAFKGTRALATTHDGTEYLMPGVTFNSLPELEEASRGRIRDVITSSAEAADGKYEIIDRGGNTVLLTREEYDEYVRQHPDLPGPRPTGTTQRTN